MPGRRIPSPAHVRTDQLPSSSIAEQVLDVAASSYSLAFAITMGVIACFMLLMGLTATWLLRRPTIAPS